MPKGKVGRVIDFNLKGGRMARKELRQLSMQSEKKLGEVSEVKTIVRFKTDDDFSRGGNHRKML